MIYREFALRQPSVWSALTAFVKANYEAVIKNGRMIRIIVTEEERKRSTEQNRRYFGYVLKTIADQAWVDGRQFNADVWHEYFARKFGICEDVTLPDGEVIVRRKSTTDMSVGDFADYMTRVEVDAAQSFGVEWL